MKELFSEDTWLDIYDSFTEWIITELPSLLLLIAATFIVLRILSFSLRKIKKLMLKRIRKHEATKEEESEKRAVTLLGIVKGLIKIVVWSIFIMMFLETFGLNLGPILAGAGIIGLAVGFGAQELVRDFIAGFFILLENQIRRGDVVVLNQTPGKVESIELRTTVLRDLTGAVHVFQNGKINTITNLTKEWSFIMLGISVAYKENIDHVMRIMEETAKQLEKIPEYSKDILAPLDIMGLDRFADSALVIKARIKTSPGDQWQIGRAYRKLLKENFDRENIEIPFPHLTLYMGDKHLNTKIIENPPAREKNNAETA